MYLQSGPAKILASGQATTFMGAGLHIAFEVEEQAFTLELLFSSDASVEDVAVSVEHTAHGLILHCVNFDEADGRGSSVPVALGEVAEYLVFAHFRVSRFGNTVDRTVHYTLYLAPRSVLD